VSPYSNSCSFRFPATREVKVIGSLMKPVSPLAPNHSRYPILMPLILPCFFQDREHLLSARERGRKGEERWRKVGEILKEGSRGLEALMGCIGSCKLPDQVIDCWIVNGRERWDRENEKPFFLTPCNSLQPLANTLDSLKQTIYIRCSSYESPSPLSSLLKIRPSTTWKAT